MSNNNSNGHHHHHHHPSNVSNISMATSDFPDVLGNDELAANLIKCATYVKLGETHHPLLRQTIQDLTFFVTGKRVVYPSGSTNNNSTQPIPMVSGGPLNSQPSPASSTLSKKTVSNLATGMITKLGLHNDDHSSVGSARTDAQKAASSMKHAESAKSDIQRALGTSTTTSTSTSTRAILGSHNPKKPPFQTPANKTSSLIANGWIEQQRRSKLRVVWKEVLASLVDGRKPGEETTLWIQREYVNPSTGKTELEALHQIPIKLIRHIGYQEYTSDHRFLIKVHNMHEDFIFRCEKSEEAAQTWVSTIRSVIDIIKEQKRSPNGEKVPMRVALDHLESEKRAAAQQQRPQSQLSIEASQSLSFDDEKKVPEQNPYPVQQHATQEQQQHLQQSAQRVESPPVSNNVTYPNQPPQPANITLPQQMSVTEMRAIAHGAGIQTQGLERGELERIVQQIALSIQTSTGGGVSPPPPSASSQKFAVPSHNAPSVPLKPVADSSDEIERQRQQQIALERQQQMEEAARRRKLAEDAARNQAAAVEAQQALLRQQQEALEKQQRAEEERKRLEAERLRRVEQEHQQRLAEQQAAEQRRRQEEQQRLQQEQWKQQQEQWQKQQSEDEQRRRAEEQRLAEEKRRQEEMYRAQHQQWQQQQQQQQGGVPPQQWQHQQHAPGAPAYGQPPPQQYRPGHPGGPQPSPHPGQQPHHGNSQVDQKYANMATQVGDTEQRSLQIIKHGILVEWALQPPAMQILRPIEVLITTVHTVFPPKYGVPGHEHFKKWSVVTLPDVLSGTQPDDEKLSKVVKKLRFVLHPDKLPREFTKEQVYICRMVWDIVSDAFEDHKKKEEELAWMR